MNRPRSARGQAATETVLVLPLLVWLGFDLLQLGCVLWMRVLLQHAVRSAARAYAVWQPIDDQEAQRRALRAAAMALGPGFDPQALRLDILTGEARQPGPDDAGQPGVHQLTLQTSLRIVGPLGPRWELKASSAILREEALPDVADSQ